MMNQASQLKAQAWLDGELPSSERAEWDRRAESEPETKALIAELKRANSGLAVFEGETKVPASRDFYFSRIKREITRQEALVDAPGAGKSLWNSLWRVLAPVSITTAILMVGWFAGQQPGLFKASSERRLEAALSSPGSFTYRDFASGTTLVWLSYPAENDVVDYDLDFTLP